MESKVAELITQFVTSLEELIAQQEQEKQIRLIDECIDAKLSAYNPTAHPKFADAARDAVEGKVTMDAVTDAIDEALDRYDPADARHFSNSVVEAVRGEMDGMVRDVIRDGTFELVMR